MLSGPVVLLLTNSQIDHINKAIGAGTGLVLNLSNTQLLKQGEFLVALLGGYPFLAQFYVRYSVLARGGDQDKRK